MSTFSGLNTAYTGLVAARQGMDVVGQNIANVNTDGYTRQRVTTSSIGPVSGGMFSSGVRPGQGVSVDGIARLADAQLDSRVRVSAAIAGYSAVRANAMVALEATLHEPGPNGLSAQLQNFWAAWQDLSNRPGEPSATGVLLQQAGTLTSQIAAGYREVEGQWKQVRGDVDAMTAELNDAAAQVADLNARIRSTLATGGAVNEMLDARTKLTTTIAAIAGGTVREKTDGTVDVLIGGNAIVFGDKSRSVQIVGAPTLVDLGSTGSAGAVRLVWGHDTNESVALDGGEIAGALSMLAAANANGTGGPIAEAAASYNSFAADLVKQINDIYQNAGGENLFDIADPANAAQSLTVVPKVATDVRAGAVGKDGSIADAISQLGVLATGPSNVWATFVTKVAVATRSELQQATMADIAATSAATMQQSNAGVDLDEENVNLLMFQHAYQGAARVMTAVDEMLDTLINRTGLVGR